MDGFNQRLSSEALRRDCILQARVRKFSLGDEALAGIPEPWR